MGQYKIYHVTWPVEKKKFWKKNRLAFLKFFTVLLESEESTDMEKIDKVSQILEKCPSVKLNQDFFVVAGEGKESDCKSHFFHTYPQCFLE